MGCQHTACRKFTQRLTVFSQPLSACLCVCGYLLRQVLLHMKSLRQRNISCVLYLKYLLVCGGSNMQQLGHFVAATLRGTYSPQHNLMKAICGGSNRPQRAHGGEGPIIAACGFNFVFLFMILLNHYLKSMSDSYKLIFIQFYVLLLL